MNLGSNKIRVRCPHCGEHIEAQRLLDQPKYRNTFGLDVFECPQCHQEFKIEPRLYLIAREGMEKGEIPGGVAIAGAKVDERLPSEMMALKHGHGAPASWRRLALLAGTTVALVVAYLFLR